MHCYLSILIILYLYHIQSIITHNFIIMAHSAPNSIDPDMFQRVSESEAQTIAKPAPSVTSAFVKKTLHPPSAISNYEGMPTNDARTQVVTEWRGIDLLNQPTTLANGLSVQPIASFNEYAFLIPNGGRVKYIGFVRDPGSAIWYQDLANVGIVDTYNWSNWYNDANLYRPAYRSTTTYLNATMFNNVGMVSGCQFNPNILFSGTLLSLAETHSDLFRKLIPALVRDKRCKILKSSAASDDQLINWAKVPLSIRTDIADMLGLKTDLIDLDPNTSFQLLNFNNSGEAASVGSTDSFIPSMSQIMMQSQRSYAGKAMEGTFTVQRLNTIAPEWLAATNTNAGAGVPINKGLYNCTTYWIDAAGVPHQVPFLDSAPIGTPNADVPTLKDTLWSKDMTFAWIHYKGLSLNTTLTPDVAFEIISIKTYIGLEIQPANRSAWAGMMQLSPKPSLEAMQMLMDGFYDLKDCMPAMYNFWGVIGKVALQGLKTLGSTLLKEVTNEVTERQSNGNKTVKRDKKGGVVKALTQRVNNLAVRETAVERAVAPPRAPRARRPRAPRAPTTPAAAAAQPAARRPKQRRRKRYNPTGVLATIA
jgi:hypothetical protein